MTSQSNLKKIGGAMRQCAEDHSGHVDLDIRNTEGKSLLSWRVSLLPYVEEIELYKQFKLDEPWDSDHNKKLIEKMPTIYAPVRVKAKPGDTFYQMFTGEKTFHDPKAKYRIYKIPDGAANTALVFEAGEPVIWTKPTDMPFDEEKPLPKLGGIFDGDFNVVLADGSVIRLKKDRDEKELKYLIMPGDGHRIDFDKLRNR
jgi:hypothetical protein